MEICRYISDKPTAALSRYKPRPGDCDGGDIGGVLGVTTVVACAEKCDDVAECVGFVYVTSQQTKCFLKMALCVDTYKKEGATMYDGVSQNSDPQTHDVDTATDVMSRYRSRPGDCPGSDISGSEVTSINTCAERCDRTPTCVAFSYVTIQADYCWLKMTSCNVTSPMLGVTMYDVIVRGGHEYNHT
ncbi:hypothetical protein NP493_233g01017 [Ridgeia piscesae]|uniref:Apple domain-containing protein n=1 Tax=Ridgeia piscesae TaxID=27915 RepID=A0AAD9NZV9_RIDPI|nr:hypothetical protein NP493_233g01017 [Ridgeia piscesae]